MKDVTFTREFPPGCGNLMSLNLPCKHFHCYTRDYPPGCGPNAPKITPLCSSKEPGRMQNSGSGCKPPLGTTGKHPGLGSRKLNVSNERGRVVEVLKERGRMKSSGSGDKPPLPPTGRQSSSGSGSGSGSSPVRQRVVEMLRLFRERCDQLSKKGVKRVDIEANKELTREGKIIKAQHKFGSVPGVEVGDKFYYRVELVIAGLHRLFQGGIDAIEEGGTRFATCIVANEGHLDKMSDPNVLSYIGEGGTLKRDQVGVPPDQVLTAGNLALNNSRLRKKPVRVVRGLRYGSGNAKIVYVYDGLYQVSETVQKRGPQGNLVFEFRMSRIAGQPVVPWMEYKRQLG